MRIGIDARMYQKGLGIGRYIGELITHIEKLDTEDEYILFFKKDNWNMYHPRSKRFRKVLADIPWYGWKEQIFFPWIIWREQVDLMHFPHFTVPFAYRAKFVVTIHDIIMQKMPWSARRAATTLHPFLYNIKYWIYTLSLKSAINRACAVLTVSDTTKNDLIATLHTHTDKITVTYEGSPLPVANIREVQGIIKPFFLTVGSAYPHKNLDILLYAWKHMCSKDRCQYHLVLCGQDDYFTKRFCSKIKEMGLEAYVHHKGTVSDEELAWLYQNAVALIAPSLEEGFGLPAVEALTYGTPVIASRIAIFEEILGDSALYFDPKNPEELIKHLESDLLDPVFRDNHAMEGMARSKRYQWDTTAQKTIDVYKKYCA